MHLSKRSIAPLAALAIAVAGLWITKPVTLQGKDGPPAQKKIKVRGRDAIAGDVIVKFKRKLKKAEDDQLNYQMDADSSRDLGHSGLKLIHSKSYDPDVLLQFLERHPDVDYVEPNYVIQIDAVPNDPNFSHLWGLLNTDRLGVDIGATAAWALSTGSKANVVAVIDSGVDYTHPDLVGNIWSAPHSFTVNIGWTTVTCAAGTHGFNALTNSCDPMDDNAHGTHVAGTIGATGNNGIGVAGVNWTGSIMAAKFLDANGSGTTAGAINAIEFVLQAKAATGANVRVLSNSWGGAPFSQALLEEVNKANASDMLFVAASGNNGRNNDVTGYYPANYAVPNVVSVTATDSFDALPWYSNYGATTVDLGAPGQSILSTVPNGDYTYNSGTSMAVPHVSGAAALVLSRCALTPAALRTLLINTVDRVASLATTTVSRGRLNVGRALQSCIGSAADFSIAANPSSRSVSSGGSAGYALTVTPLVGFTGTVSFSVSGLPAGATANFAPATVTSSGVTTLTVATTAATPAGTFPLTVTATSGALAHAVTLSLIVTQTQPPDFTIVAGPATQTVDAGQTTTYLATISPLRGFGGAVTFSASGLPAGVTATFSPSTVWGSGSSNLSVRTTGATPLGTYTLTLTGTSGALTHSTTVTMVVVTQQPDFTLTSLVSATRQVRGGADASFLILVAPVAGFTGTITLTANPLANGTTTTFVPATVTLNGVAAKTTSLNVDLSNWRRYHYDIVVTATGGGVTHTLNLDLDVK